MTPHEIMDLIGKHGVPVIITGGVLLLSWSAAKTWLRTWQVKIERPKVNLKEHQFFALLYRNCSVIIPGLEISDPGRRLMAQDFLRLKATVAREKMIDLIEKDLDEVTEQVWATEASRAISDIVQSYETKATEGGVADIFIREFREWHQDTVDQTFGFIESLSRAVMASNTDRTNALLSWLEVAFQWSVTDTGRSIGRINGALTGFVYRGVTLGKLNP